MDPGELADLTEIQQVLARYAVGMTKDDIESVMAVFTADGSYSAFGDTYSVMAAAGELSTVPLPEALGLGSGENLNEHVVGQRWPTIARRQEMLREAIQIIRELHTGELVDWKGEHFEVDSARIWDVPDVPVPIAAAVSGDRSVQTFAPLADHLIAVEPKKDLVDAWHDARRATGLPGDVRVIHRKVLKVLGILLPMQGGHPARSVALHKWHCVPPAAPDGKSCVSLLEGILTTSTLC